MIRKVLPLIALLAMVYPLAAESPRTPWAIPEAQFSAPTYEVAHPPPPQTRRFHKPGPSRKGGWTPADLRREARQAARTWRVDERVFLALVQRESTWHPRAISPLRHDPALGLVQIRCATARHVGFEGPCHRLLTNPLANLFYGAKYLRVLLDRAGGDYETALAAYYAGPTRWREISASPDGFQRVRAKVRDYVNEVYHARRA